MRLGEMELEAAAKAAAGNWRHFDCFCWHRQPNDADQWAIVYTHNRDSGLLDQSNAAAIEAALEPFTEGDDPTVVFESHFHWAVGHVDGASIRVYRRGCNHQGVPYLPRPGPAYGRLPGPRRERLQQPGIRSDPGKPPRCRLEAENEYELPEGWEGAVYGWFSENDCSAIESSDDQGGYPTEDQLRAAFEALGYRQANSCKRKGRWPGQGRPGRLELLTPTGKRGEIHATHLPIVPGHRVSCRASLPRHCLGDRHLGAKWPCVPAERYGGWRPRRCQPQLRQSTRPVQVHLLRDRRV